MSASYAQSKYKFVTLVNLFALAVVFVALIFISSASFIQTVSAFMPMADNIVIFGVNIGITLPWMFGILFQYGQNVALYIRAVYCNNVPLATFYLFGRRITLTSRNLVFAVFWITSIVDALTNVVWFYRTVDLGNDVILAWMLRLIGYPAMVLVVMVEEALGWVWQALRRVFREYRNILNMERAQARNSSATLDEPVAAPAQRRPSQPTYSQPYTPPTTSTLRPASQINRPVAQPHQTTFNPPEPTYHPVSYEARSDYDA